MLPVVLPVSIVSLVDSLRSAGLMIFIGTPNHILYILSSFVYNATGIFTKHTQIQ